MAVIARIRPISMIPTTIAILFKGNPAIKAIIPIMATITAIEPKSLWTPATSKPITTMAIKSGFKVFFKSVMVLVLIALARNIAIPITTLNLTSSTDWNDKLPNLTHLCAGYAGLTGKTIASNVAPRAKIARGLNKDFHLPIGISEVAKKAITLKPTAKSCLEV